MRFGGGVPSKHIGEEIVDGENYSPNVSEIHMKNEMKFAANLELVETVCSVYLFLYFEKHSSIAASVIAH